ncbi:hypothetical protein IWW55_000486 [Coemansia sp. RSA 2706]|nr:hypothetical protein LPJ63_004396 [Coemansia sp. RSA 2711]KAJ1842488.1 hypothetical protein LPJ70_003795 [Coemansia sp. RSA 2708]KAJ2308359.1 hypothetical protein IWW55_000486 [Coemansia sp. RSA 2706]KAJ2310813.1 hypothetical protein IWW54_002989 [Coemansia sp. RSA 2705]
MRLSIIATQMLAASALAMPAALKRRQGQEIEAEGGDQVSGGPSALSNPVINNGQMVDSSLVTGSGGGADGAGAGDFINNAFGNSIVHVNSNSANKDNLVINPTTISSNGNGGPTANGNHDNLGDTQNVFPGFRKRDSWVTAGAVDSHWVDAVPYYPAVPLYAPGFAYFPVAPVGPQVTHNQQNAAIVQNQA